MKLEYTLKNVYQLNSSKGSCRLIGGMNEVPDDIWNEVKDTKAIKDRIDAGILVVKGSSNISKMAVKDAIELVKGTVNVETLAAWQKEVSDKSVLKAIDNQLKEIDKQAVDAENENAGGEGDELSKMKKDELLEIAQSMGLEVDKSMNKDQLIEAIENADEEPEGGEEE